jgi:hypothetical protein
MRGHYNAIKSNFVGITQGAAVLRPFAAIWGYLRPSEAILSLKVARIHEKFINKNGQNSSKIH